MSELAAHQISTFSLIALIGIYSYFVIRWFPPNTANQSLLIGIIWTFLTLVFEFSFGMMRGSSWKQLLHAYNVIEGQIWILIPIWVAIAPYIFFKILKN